MSKTAGAGYPQGVLYALTVSDTSATKGSISLTAASSCLRPAAAPVGHTAFVFCIILYYSQLRHQEKGRNRARCQGQPLIGSTDLKTIADQPI